MLSIIAISFAYYSFELSLFVCLDVNFMLLFLNLWVVILLKSHKVCNMIDDNEENVSFDGGKEL